MSGGAADIDILIPTCNRAPALAVTLTSLCAQTLRCFRVVISDQSDPQPRPGGPFTSGEVQAALQVLRAHGHAIETHVHLPRRGLAEHRDFLLGRAQAAYCLFLDDDVILEPDVLQRMYDVLRQQGCGFVGSALQGLSCLDDIRPHQQHIEFWDGPVQPEQLRPGGAEWQRHHLHSAANLTHVQQRLGLSAANQRLYKVAWVGGCVLFDTAKLRDSGGFGFWPQLPEQHCGEDVVAQLQVMARYGGCALIPSGAYHQELPTTVKVRNIDAPHVLLGDRPPAAAMQRSTLHPQPG